MGNYIVVLSLPDVIDRNIRTAYQKTFDKDISISNLHLTLLPQFKLKSISQRDLVTEVGNLNFSSPQVNLGNVGFFRYLDGVNLYLSINPTGILDEYHKFFVNKLGSKIEFDKSVYESGEVPEFLAHISLDYNFTNPEKLLTKFLDLIPKTPFLFVGPFVLHENSFGMWEKV